MDHSSDKPPFAAGTYILSGQGEVVEIIELRPSGRLQRLTYDQVVIDAGYWRAEGNTLCFDLDGEGEGRENRCWRRDGVPRPDGAFAIKSVDGETRYWALPVIKAELDRYRADEELPPAPPAAIEF